MQRRPADGPLFLPVDRAFTIKGFGTVVTGTLLSGMVEPEASVSLLPGLPGPFRVRGVQTHGQTVPRGSAGQRTAVNLPNVATQDVRRGMVLVRAGELPETRSLDVELTLLPAAEGPLTRRRTLLLHLGTAQVEARLTLLDLPELAPGETGLAQLRLQAPVAALPGQRFILRGARPLPGRGATLAGGRVLTIGAPRRRRGAAELLAPMREEDLDARLVWLARQSGYRGMTSGELAVRTASAPKTVQRALDVLSSKGQVLLVDRERRLYLAGETFAALQARALALLQSFHDRAPLEDALHREELRQRLSPDLDPRLLGRLVQALVERGAVESIGEGLRLKGRGRSLSLDEEAARTKAVAAIAAGALAPPTLAEIGRMLSLPVERVAGLLQGPIADHTVVKVSEELCFHGSVLADLKQRLVAHLTEHREITTQQFKELVGGSRKFVIPLSEHFDREKVTLRVGDKRLLRRS